MPESTFTPRSLFSLSLLRLGGPGHVDRDDERHEKHPGSGHHPGGEEQEKADLIKDAALMVLLMVSYR